jgi:hypothetical protein
VPAFREKARVHESHKIGNSMKRDTRKKKKYKKDLKWDKEEHLGPKSGSKKR